MKGKDKCALLKSIRVRLAEINNIPYTPHPCNNTEDCSGTCELCDAEAKWLLYTLKELENQGYPIRKMLQIQFDLPDELRNSLDEFNEKKYSEESQHNI